MEMQEVETQALEPQVNSQDSVEDMILGHIETVDKGEQNATSEESDELKADQDGEQEKELEGKEKDSAADSSGKAGEEDSENKAQAETAESKDQEEAAVEAGESGEKEVFNADLSYTFRGKKHDLPEELKGVIDSKEKLEYYQDIFSKAEGLPIIKEKGMLAQANLDEVTQNLDQFYQHVGLGDFSKAFELAEIKKPSISELARGFGFSDKDVIEYAYQRAQMSEEQVRSEQVKSEADRRIQELEMRVNQSEQSVQTQMQQQVYSELQSVISDPTYRDIVQAYDAKNGDGAFVSEVGMRGDLIYRTTNRIERPAALVKQVVERYNLGSLVNQPVSQTQNNVTSQPASNTKKQNVGDVPVIPAIESGGGSPGQRTIRSLDDIEKILQEKYGS